MLKRFILALIALAAPLQADPAKLVGNYTWVENSPGFGGFSGLEVTPDGAGFTVISDRGAVIKGRFGRRGGRIISVTPVI